MTANRCAGLSAGGFRELDRASLVRTNAGGAGGLAGLGRDALSHAGSRISNNWNRFKECFRKEMDR